MADEPLVDQPGVQRRRPRYPTAAKPRSSRAIRRYVATELDPASGQKIARWYELEPGEDERHSHARVESGAVSLHEARDRQKKFPFSEILRAIPGDGVDAEAQLVRTVLGVTTSSDSAQVARPWQEPANDGNGPRYVGFWSRAVGESVDGLILLAITAVLVVAGFVEVYVDEAGGKHYRLPLWIWAGYFIGFWIWKAATPGKLLLGARIVDEHTLQPAHWFQLVVRFLFRILSGLALGIGFIWVAFDSRKRGWHDHLAKTVVVRPERPGVR